MGIFFHVSHRRVYLAYMDSIHFFQPRQFRTAVYHEILIGYLDYVKLLGYVFWYVVPRVLTKLPFGFRLYLMLFFAA